MIFGGSIGLEAGMPSTPILLSSPRQENWWEDGEAVVGWSGQESKDQVTDPPFQFVPFFQLDTQSNCVTLPHDWAIPGNRFSCRHRECCGERMKIIKSKSPLRYFIYNQIYLVGFKMQLSKTGTDQRGFL